MMNWITFWCVAIFLSCQYSVGHGTGEPTELSKEEFDERYRSLVKPEIQKDLHCQYMPIFDYIEGTQQVCIRRGPRLLVFCTID